MKNKTILAIAFFAISLLIIPQMTFASWWKPNTWKIFNKKSEVKIERTSIATSTPNNTISPTKKTTTTPTASRSSDQSVGAEKIEQKSEEVKKNDQSKEIEKLKKEMEVLKQKQPQIKIIEKTTEKPIIAEKKESSSSQTKQNENIVTLPNGAVVEMDANGNISRTIKEAPQQIYIAPVINIPTVLSISAKGIKITLSSAHVEWNTNIPTDSKLFLTQPDGSTKIIISASGNSTIHFVDITLVSGTSYTYTIEAISGTQSKKIDGSFVTQQQTFTAESVKSPTNTNDTVPFLKLSSDRPFTIKKLVFLDDGSYCQSGYPFVHLNLQYLSQGKDASIVSTDFVGRFIFDYSDGLTISDITFRLSGGTSSKPSSSCIYKGMKFILRDSESIVYGENGKQIDVPHVVLIGK